MPVKRKLTREERARLREILGRTQKEKYPSTAQQTIPYDRIWPDGICLANEKFYTKTLQFQDINYQLAQNEDKTAIFEGWCDFLNYFDSSIHFQLSFVNLAVRTEEFEQSVAIPLRGDDADESRIEYAAMLQNQLAKGNNGLRKTKYITFGIEADSIKTAKPRLERIETDLVNHFKQLGAAVETLNGKERLRLLHSIFHMDTQEKFAFEWDWLPRTGLSTKDFIAPTGFEFREGRRFRMGGTLGAVSFLQILAPELNDRMLADFLNMESSLIVSLHIQSIDQTAAIRQIKRKITELDQSKIDEQKKAIRAGYDIDILPSDLATYGGEAKKLLEDLQSHNERMFLVTFLVMNTAGTRQQLENRVFQAQGIAQKYNCALERLDFQQEKALISSLPLGLNQIEIQRGLTTSSTAIFVPFTTQELFQTEGEPLYYGLNALSNNLIMVDRKRLKTPNGLILGTPGSGKSFSAKREITNAYLITDDDVIVCDPEGEYYPLVERFHGQVVKISPASPHYINPMDMNLNYSDDDNPLSLKSDFLLSLCELIVGGREGLQPIEKTVIDRAVRLVYQPYLADPRPENMPVLGNREDLFRGNPYASTLRDPGKHDVPEAYLEDETFRRILEEAEKYIGYPYVWGGDSPETSFDCSGFVSYVFTNSGVRNVGRLGATSLYGACRKITPEEAKPGDLVFFEKTISGVDGITHCGIYVGDGFMLHCGSPIGYADLRDSYWQQHFFGYGRLVRE